MKRLHILSIEGERVWLVWVLLLAAVLRLSAILLLDHEPVSDEGAYRSMALNLVEGRGIVDSAGNRALYNVGYSLFVLAPVYHFFGDSLLMARLANLLLGLVTVVLCYFVAKEAGANRVGRILATAFWALYLPTGVYAVYLAKENLMAPLMLGVVWCALRLIKYPSAKLAFGCGILFGLLALVGNAAFSLFIAVVLAVGFSPGGWRRRVGLLALAGITALLVASPWMIRNLNVLGAPVLNTNGGFNLYLGNNPAATGWFVSIADTPRGPTWHDLKKDGEIQAADTLKREALAWIKDHPIPFTQLALKKLVYFWTPPFHEGEGRPSAAERLIRWIWMAQFVFLLMAAAAGWLIKSMRTRQIAVLWISVACYTGVHMLFYVIFRYREPIMPIVGILAAMSLSAMLAKYGRSGRPLCTERERIT